MNTFIPQKNGFTLVELVFVILVTAIISAAVIPRLAGSDLLQKYSAYTAAHMVSSDMRLARRIAVDSGDNTRVVFSMTGGSGDYNAYNIQEDTSSGWVNRGGQKTIPDEVNVSGDGSVTFTPDGAAVSAAGFVYTRGDNSFTVSVKRATGSVKVTGN